MHEFGTKLLQKQEISRRAFWVLALFLVGLKLLLVSRQYVYLVPEGAYLDDTLMYDTAVSIASGNWLGEYHWLTLSKYMFFPLWLAGLHTLGIPYLLGGQLLYTAACAVGVAAFAPVLRRNLTRLGLFAFLLFSPAAWAAAVQLRVYRDNITPALALFLFAGFAGAALRWQKGIKATWGYLLAGGFGLAASYLNREDGAWYLAFTGAATLITMLFIFTEKQGKQKFVRCIAQLLPYGVLGAGILVFCSLNFTHYGRFLVSDFTSKEFKDACGALMRVSAAEPMDRVPVTYATRNLLYAQVPQFAALEPYFEGEGYLNGFANVESHEYEAGSFYWGLRRAVWAAGFADTALEAKAYYTDLAETVNALCDAGALPAFPKNGRVSTTVMPPKPQDIVPTLQKSVVYFGQMLWSHEAAPAFAEISICPPHLQAEYESFLKETCNLSAQENTNLSYYSKVDKLAFGTLAATVWGYRLALPLLFALSMGWLVWQGGTGARLLAQRRPWAQALLWLLCLGLGLAVWMRCGIVGYMFVSSFHHSVGKLLYLCGAYPALLLCAYVGAVQCVKAVRAVRAVKKEKVTIS